MKHQRYNNKVEFVKEPVEFNKYTEREFLQYCLGATMYMPGTKDIAPAILSNKWPELTSMVMCFEDAIDEKDLPQAEKNVKKFLDTLNEALEQEKITNNDLPLLIVRVRNVEQFKRFTNSLTKEQISLLTAFNFPKFTSDNANDYLSHLRELNYKHDEILYGMPILESKAIAFTETRIHELLSVRNVMKAYRDLILNIRVGATDFSSYFGVRRNMDYTIYDILMVRDCLSDILNLLGRGEEDYIISAPVWEFFSTDKNMKFKEDIDLDIHDSLLRREPIANPAVDGLLREIILDKANGFVGKTIIHPSHIKYVNALQAVTKEEYEDAVQILETEGGVVKSATANKMNEINPHRSWAQKIFYKAKAYGVIERGADYIKLFSQD